MAELGSEQPGHAGPIEERAYSRELRARWLLIVLTVVAVVALLGALVFIAAQNNRNGDQILSCTTPEGECYQRGQEQTGNAVATINQITIAANYCSLKFTGQLTEADFHTFTACVRAHVDISR